MTDDKPSDARVVVWILILAIIPMVIFFRTKSAPVPPPPILVPLGTNLVTKGTAYYNPANREQQIGTILESDNAYEFPDGNIEPGFLVRSKVTGLEIWVPREKMMKVLVEATMTSASTAAIQQSCSTEKSQRNAGRFRNGDRETQQTHKSRVRNRSTTTSRRSAQLGNSYIVRFASAGGGRFIACAIPRTHTERGGITGSDSRHSNCDLIYVERCGSARGTECRCRSKRSERPTCTDEV